MSIPDSTAYSLWSNYFKPVQETCTAQGDKQNLGLHTILIPTWTYRQIYYVTILSCFCAGMHSNLQTGLKKARGKYRGRYHMLNIF